MNEARVNAAIAELNAIIQSLAQRVINLAGDLAEAHVEIKRLSSDSQPKEKQNATK